MRGYRLTSGDLIRATTGDWDGFARENSGGRAVSSAILGQSLWDMISGAATCRFLAETFYNCRRTQTALGLLYRCDSPAVERLFLMRVTPVPGAEIEVQHQLIRCRPLRLLPLRDLDHLRYRRCSQCLACNFGGPWVEAQRFRLPAGAVADDAVCPVCQAAAFVAQPEAEGMRPQLCG